MTASLWLVAGLACAQLGQTTARAAADLVQNVAKQVETAPSPSAAASPITDVTVYHLGYTQRLGGFTSTALTGLTEKGRLDSEAILALSRFVMESRGAKAKNETELRVQLQANGEAAEFARRQLAELSSGTASGEPPPGAQVSLDSRRQPDL
jgi:hypothetical protein